MKIQVGGLSEGLHEYRLEAPASMLMLEENFSGEVVVDVVLEKTGRQIVLKAGIRTPATFACDRCLERYTTSLSCAYQMYYLLEGTDTANLDPAEVQYLAPGSTVIDLTDDVRQTILLSVPLKLLCAESCEGLCPHCGKNLNTGPCGCTETAADPRWEKLRSLRDSNSEDWAQNREESI
jgi:uncharacterized protein